MNENVNLFNQSSAERIQSSALKSAFEEGKIEVKGVDNTIKKIAATLHNPKNSFLTGLFAENRVSVRLEGQKDPVYVKVSELAKATGISEKSLLQSENKSGGVAALLEKQEALVAMVDKIAGAVRKQMGSEAFGNLVRFAGEQLQGRVKPQKAGKQLAKSDQKMLLAMIRSGRNGTYYIGKIKGKVPSLFVDKEGTAHFGGEKVGKGSFTKVTDLSTLTEVGSKRVKAAAKGGDAVQSLEKHLQFVERLNKQGVRHIPKTHYVKILTKTKKAEPKLVALIDKLDGDGEKITKGVELKRADGSVVKAYDWSVHPAHTCNILASVAEGLADMHDAGVVHCDFKPGNILLRGALNSLPETDSDGNPMYVDGVVHDFGLSANRGSTIGGGTLMTLPPEAVKNDEILAAKATPELDSFSLGVTITVMASSANGLAGGKLFGNATNDQEIRKRFETIREAILDPASSRPGTGQERLLRMRMLDVAQLLVRHDPKQRISCREAAEVLSTLNDNLLDDISEGKVDEFLDAYRKAYS